MENKNRLYVLLLILASFLFFYSSIENQLSMDDMDLFSSLINSSLNVKSLFFGVHKAYYRPLLILSFHFDYMLWKDSLSFFHLMNILIHCCNTVLVYLMSKAIYPVLFNVGRYKKTTEEQLSFVSALLFCIHPLATESVNWISGRTDLLATLFILWSLLFVLKFILNGRYCDFAYGMLTAFAGMLSKESAVALFLVVPYLLIISDFKLFKQRIFHSFLFCLLLPIYYLLRTASYPALDQGGGKVVEVVKDMSILTYLEKLTIASGFYVKKLFVYTPLNFAITEVSYLYFFFGLFIIGLVLVSFICHRFRFISLLVVAILLFSPALPVALGNIAWTKYAERYLYASIPFASIFIVFGFYLLFVMRWHSQKIFYFFITMLIITFSVSTYNRNQLWKDSSLLYAETIKHSPYSPILRNEYAVALRQNGSDFEAEKQFYIGSKLLSKASALPKINYIMSSDMSLYAKKSAILEMYDEFKKTNRSVLRILINLNNGISKDLEGTDSVIPIYKENERYFSDLFELENKYYYRYRQAQYLLALKEYQAAYDMMMAVHQNIKDDLYKRLSLKIAKDIKQEHLLTADDK